jgi:putative ABC transport system permease protein
VLSYFVNERHQEIGVRMALGANVRQVVNFVLSRAMAMVAIGLIFGLVGSFWASRLIQRLLFQVESADPSTLGAVTLSFVVVALMTCALPAWRASRVDPASALQAE